MNDILRIARLRFALQREFLGRAILRVIVPTDALFYDALGNDQSLVQLCGILFPSKSNH